MEDISSYVVKAILSPLVSLMAPASYSSNPPRGMLPISGITQKKGFGTCFMKGWPGSRFFVEAAGTSIFRTRVIREDQDNGTSSKKVVKAKFNTFFCRRKTTRDDSDTDTSGQGDSRPAAEHPYQ